MAASVEMSAKMSCNCAIFLREIALKNGEWPLAVEMAKEKASSTENIYRYWSATCGPSSPGRLLSRGHGEMYFLRGMINSFRCGGWRHARRRAREEAAIGAACVCRIILANVIVNKNSAAACREMLRHHHGDGDRNREDLRPATRFASRRS